MKIFKNQSALKAQYFNNIFNSVHGGILIFEKNGKLVFGNRFFESIFFQVESQVLGPPEKRGLYFQDIFKIKNTKKYYIFNFDKFSGQREYPFFLCNQRQTPVACRFNKVNNPGQGKNEVVVTFSDLTEVKNMAHQNRKLQKQLIKSAYRAGMAENAVEVLHNIGNVLAAIIGNTSENTNLNDLMDIVELLLKIDAEKVDVYDLLSALKEELVMVSGGLKRDFDFITNKASHIADVIATQQRYANTNEEIKTSVNLSRIVEQCLHTFEAQILKSNIEIVHHSNKSLHIFVEENGMLQALSNVILNACQSVQKAIAQEKRNKGKIEVRCWPEGEMAVLQVADNGLGLASEDLSRALDSGFSTKERPSGLGLSNCAQFVKRSKGQMAIDNNNAAEGACVTFKLPLYRERAQKIPQSA